MGEYLGDGVCHSVLMKFVCKDGEWWSQVRGGAYLPPLTSTSVNLLFKNLLEITFVKLSAKHYIALFVYLLLLSI